MPDLSLTETANRSVQSGEGMNASDVAQLVPATDMQHHRFHILDALRGIAALLIVLWHAPGSVLSRGNHSTFLAVDFFCCLSGFVIAFSYERRLATTFTFRQFFAARIIRLYPLYLLGIVIGSLFIMLAGFGNQGAPIFTLSFIVEVCLQLLMLPCYFLHTSIYSFPLDFPAWSLFFELLANLAFAALVRAKLARTWHLLAVASISLVLLLSASNIDVGAASDLHALLPGFARVTFSFLLGVLVLRLYRHTSRKRLPALHGLSAVALALVLILLLQSPFTPTYTRTFHEIDIVLLLPALIFVGAHVPVPHAWIGLCATLGDLSFPIYLLHAHAANLLLIISSLSFISGPTHHLQRAGITVLMLPLLLVASYLASKLYDVPTRRWLRTRWKRWSPA